eukprot:808437-Pyramimonas_sp.AAC.2
MQLDAKTSEDKLQFAEPFPPLPLKGADLLSGALVRLGDFRGDSRVKRVDSRMQRVDRVTEHRPVRGGCRSHAKWSVESAEAEMCLLAQGELDDPRLQV